MTTKRRKPPAPPRPAHRPPLPDGERLVVATVRVTVEQKAKLRRLGAQRVRQWIDRAKE